MVARASAVGSRTVDVLEQSQTVPVGIEEAFAFYGEALNLEAITPPWLEFRVITPTPIAIGPGALIDYRLKLHGIPTRWRTRIEHWEPPRRFIDVQVRGPYALWEHTHSFEVAGPEATRIHDRVRYSLPLGALGRVGFGRLVRRDLRRIFDYRRDVVGKELGSVGAAT